VLKLGFGFEWENLGKLTKYGGTKRVVTGTDKKPIAAAIIGPKEKELSLIKNSAANGLLLEKRAANRFMILFPISIRFICM
jgi:hypothetical protein